MAVHLLTRGHIAISYLAQATLIEVRSHFLNRPTMAKLVTTLGVCANRGVLASQVANTFHPELEGAVRGLVRSISNEKKIQSCLSVEI